MGRSEGDFQEDLQRTVFPAFRGCSRHWPKAWQEPTGYHLPRARVASGVFRGLLTSGLPVGGALGSPRSRFRWYGIPRISAGSAKRLVWAVRNKLAAVCWWLWKINNLFPIASGQGLIDPSEIDVIINGPCAAISKHKLGDAGMITSVWQVIKFCWTVDEV